MQTNVAGRCLARLARCPKREAAAEWRSNLFSEEKQRQIDNIARIEKVEIECKDLPTGSVLYMNKGLSTPFNVAQHLSETKVETSALALVNGEPWDMHRPFQDSASLQLLSFHDNDPFHVNRAFWRSCSFLLGFACETVFDEHVPIQLHSFPRPNVNSGSFIYDIDLGSETQWTPTKEELMAISARMHRIAQEAFPFERLVVDVELAIEMFADNPHKKKQLPNMARDGTVTLYRVHNHIDISGGPMMANSNFLGRRCSIAGVHKIAINDLPLYRFQGVALPNGIFLNHAAFGILEKRAAKLNEANLSSAQAITPS